MAGTFGKYALGVLGEVISFAVHSAKKLCLESVRGHLSRRSIRMIVSTLMRRAVPVFQHSSGFANDPVDGRMGIAFFGAFPFDQDGAAFGGEGDAAGEEGGEC